MTTYPTLAALPEPTFELIVDTYDMRLEESHARAFVRALQADFGLWDAGSETFVEAKLEELIKQFTIAVPHEYWFTAPGAAGARLTFSTTDGFALALDQSHSVKHRQAMEINALLRRIGYAF